MADSKRIDGTPAHYPSWLVEAIRQAPVGVLVTDPAGECVFVNRCWAELAGVDPPAALGRGWLEAVHPDDRPRLAARWYGEARRGGATEDEFRFLRPDGSVRWMHSFAVPVRHSDGRAVGHVGVMADVTERQRAQDAVQRLNAELEQRVRERTTQLEAAVRELESFSYSVSHDLRAPLRAIDGFSQALVEDYSERLDAQGLEYLARVRRAAQRMGELIDDLLSLSRVTRSELVRGPVDLSALAAEVADELRRAEPQRQVEVTIADGLQATGDRALLCTVLVNLLANAWKFTAQRPIAHIAVGAVAGARPAAFYVRDDGVGFEMARASKLFGAFQRLHGREEFEGTGIGLAIVQRIIARHGGRVWAEAAPAQGATFYFTLSA